MTVIPYETYLDKIHGCFLGKTVIGTLGAPYEGVKMPLELPFRPEMIDTMLPNDDLDLQVLWLDVAERYGRDFTSDQLLERFCSCCDYSPGEYAVMRKNFERGVRAPASGSFCNDFYREGMGCPIRSEIWACLSPLDPAAAADYAGRDGVIDHFGESVYAEQFLAALEAAAFGVTEEDCDLEALVRTGLSAVPAACRFRELVEDTLAFCARHSDVKTVLGLILRKYGHPDCTNLFQNMGIMLTALLKGGLDPVKTGMDALNCGFDTDCTCATAGAIVGLIRGAASLERAYGWRDVRFVLGVRSNRRSDQVRDFAEDIARLGKRWNPDAVAGGDACPFRFEAPAPVTVSAVYPTFPDGRADASIAPGETRIVGLRFENRAEGEAMVSYSVSGLGCEASGRLRLPARSSGEAASATAPVPVTIPRDIRALPETNLYTVRFQAARPGAGAPYEGERTFGLCGAVLWKAIGPIWRTEPTCTTEKLQSVPNYWHLMPRDYRGDPTDPVRAFHLNFAADTDTPYRTIPDCLAPLDPSGDAARGETLFAPREDSFRIDDIYGMRGPTTVYLARELICPDDETVCVQVGHSAPFALYINGTLAAERKRCDTWTAENVHIQNVPLHKGVNAVVLRLTRVNEDAKYSLVFSKGPTCAAHIVRYASLNPMYFIQEYMNN